VSHEAYDRLGPIPDVAQGESLVHILVEGSFSPVFSLTPDQAVRFADRVCRAAGRVREEHQRGQVRREERDAHRHLVERTPERSEPWVERHSTGLWEFAIIGGAAALLVAGVFGLSWLGVWP
jgi:hypothetical protein